MSGVIAETMSGRVRGHRTGAVVRFAGVPYGADTSGRNRFAPAGPPDPWAGVRDAFELGRSSPQIIRPGRGADIGETGEDCLVANVWTSALEGKRPVLVWIHGGGFGQGTGCTPVHDGASLAAREDVVVVSVNHRLGLLGYLGLEYLAGDSFAGSGLAGMTDLVLALEWVRDNIARFGGDPGNVTVFGHSGGGGKVATLLAMPSARGLFHRAEIHGGPPFGYRTPDAAADAAERLLARLGIPLDRAERLLELPPDQLLDAQGALGTGPFPGVDGMMFAPVVGTEHLPAHPQDVLAAGGARGIDLMVGTSIDEADYALFAHPEWLEPSFDIDVRDLTERVSQTIDAAPQGEALVDRYRSIRSGWRNIDLLRTIMSDQFLVRSRRLLEAKQAGDGDPSYAYVCDANHSEESGAFHGVQMPFFFDTVEEASKRTPLRNADDSRRLAERARRAHATFAREGAPDAGEVEWRAFGAPDRPYLVFGDSGWRVLSDPLADRIGLWDGIVATSRTDPWARLFT